MESSSSLSDLDVVFVRTIHELKTSVDTLLDIGVPVDIILKQLTESVSSRAKCPLTVNGFLSLYGVFPLINEYLEFVVARGFARKHGIPIPADMHSMVMKSGDISGYFRELFKQGRDLKRSQTREFYDTFKRAQIIVKPSARNPIDLIAMKFVENSIRNIGKAFFYIYQVKDVRDMSRANVKKVARALMEHGEKLRAALHPHIFSVTNKKLLFVEFKYRLVVTADLDKITRASVKHKKHHHIKCRIISGDRTAKLMFNDEEAREFFQNQLRREPE